MRDDDTRLSAALSLPGEPDPPALRRSRRDERESVRREFRAGARAPLASVDCMAREHWREALAARSIILKADAEDLNGPGQRVEIR